MVKFGEGCQELLDSKVRNVKAEHLEIDEQWTWVAKKQRNCSDVEHATGVIGDQYLFLAFDQKTGLIACHDIGKRTEETTHRFLAKPATRIVFPESVNEPISSRTFGQYAPSIRFLQIRTLPAHHHQGRHSLEIANRHRRPTAGDRSGALSNSGGLAGNCGGSAAGNCGGSAGGDGSGGVGGESAAQFVGKYSPVSQRRSTAICRQDGW